jgi:rfaE bifunctional protein kinase chain/domain
MPPAIPRDGKQQRTRRYLDLIDRFPARTVLLVGDLVADQFIFGEISRVSREAPVLILKHRQTNIVPGGGANAAYNLADLGARVIPLGVVGDDPDGHALLECFRSRGMDTRGVVVAPEFPTVAKSRILAGTVHGSRQQVLRIDREPSEPVLPARRAAIEKRALKLANRVDAVLISDYGYGAVTPAMAQALRGAAGAAPVTLDARYDVLRYAGLTAATPNEPEVEAAFHIKIGTDTRKLEEAARLMLRKMRLQALLVTRGRDGMALFQAGRRPVYIPIWGSDQITDVTGAGDTVIAVFTLALAAGASFEDAARLSNFGGGIVVMKRGTATVTREELRQAVKSAE